MTVTSVSLLLPLPQVFKTLSPVSSGLNHDLFQACVLYVCVFGSVFVSLVVQVYISVCPGLRLNSLCLPKGPRLLQVLILSGCRQLQTLSAGPESQTLVSRLVDSSAIVLIHKYFQWLKVCLFT